MTDSQLYDHFVNILNFTWPAIRDKLIAVELTRLWFVSNTESHECFVLSRHFINSLAIDFDGFDNRSAFILSLNGNSCLEFSEQHTSYYYGTTQIFLECPGDLESQRSFTQLSHFDLVQCLKKGQPSIPACLLSDQIVSIFC